MTPIRRPRCSLPTSLGNRSSTTSPLRTKQLHELGDFQYFWSAVLVRLQCGHLLAKCVAPSHLLSALHQGRSARFGARNAHCLKLSQRPLRVIIESNRNGDYQALIPSRFGIQLHSLRFSNGRRNSEFHSISLDIRVRKSALSDFD